ncbi:hypothetical protein [Parasitella parasitica]|uniref:Uncharacterized protein n=1 Tax=Parasitella parasitica TaxID=35722 RepID=A0A0B7N876_9FUNG|nr:hypothetical protein [Parasitella parasitica]
MGLPCAHKLKRLMLRNQQISVEDFDNQWRLRVTPTQNILLPDQIPLPEYIGLEFGYDQNEISEVNAQLEEEFSNQVLAAEARETRRTIADMYRASVLFTPNVVNQLNERGFVRSGLAMQLPFELNNPNDFRPRDRPTAVLCQAM